MRAAIRASINVTADRAAMTEKYRRFSVGSADAQTGDVKSYITRTGSNNSTVSLIHQPMDIASQRGWIHAQRGWLSGLFSLIYGGEGGIRTHVRVTPQDAFEAPPLRPLRYLSASDGTARIAGTHDYSIRAAPRAQVDRASPMLRSRLSRHGCSRKRRAPQCVIDWPGTDGGRGSWCSPPMMNVMKRSGRQPKGCIVETPHAVSPELSQPATTSALTR